MSETHVEAAGRTLRISSPDRVVFPDSGLTKLDVVEHYLHCADGVVRGVHRRPTSLKRWPKGAGDDFFFTKRAPSTISNAAAVRFPSARPGRMPYVADIADVIEQVQLGILDLNPWNARIDDLDHPDEMRLDLDPTDDFDFGHCRDAAEACRELLDEVGLVGWPKTSGNRGIHIYVRLRAEWDYFEVRRAGLALARELERRHPDLITTAWWKEEREGVFIDYNQNARDKTIASAYSVRQTGLVSVPFTWNELAEIETTDWTIPAFADRYADLGDLTAGIDGEPGDLTPVLEMVRLDEEERGLGDAPWPPHYPKMPGEPKRVSPSRAKKDE